MGKDKYKQKDEWEDDEDALFGGNPKNADRLLAKQRDKQKKDSLRRSKNRDEEFNSKV